MNRNIVTGGTHKIERERERERDRQTDRQTDRQRQRQREFWDCICNVPSTP